MVEVARQLDDLADATGARICREHGVEHLGKTAYRIHLGLALASEGRGRLDVVRDTALHLARRCRKYPHPEARAYLEDIVKQISHDWGYKYFKMDMGFIPS